MSFAMSPSQYLTVLKDELSDFKAAPLSMRRAMSVAMFGSHILEHVFAAYSSTDVPKVDGCQSLKDYREHLSRGNAIWP